MKEKPNFSRLFRYAITFFGAAIGCGLVVLVLRVYLSMEEVPALSDAVVAAICAGAALIFALLLWALSPAILRLLKRWSGSVEGSLDGAPLMQIASGALGLVIGLVIAALIAQLFRTGLPELLWAGIAAILHLVFGYLGASIGAKRWREFPGLFGGKQPKNTVSSSAETGSRGTHSSTVHKILDTSVVIDGRILDVCKTGFVEGPLVIPQFILAELRHIADSSDPLRRNRGRRGLDVLAQIQNELDVEALVSEIDFEDEPEVDVKLLKLAKEMDGVVVTNDFNLNKVASVTGVKVLNLNDLAGALRPVLLPGEGMTVHILREGKEHGQGVGYMDDGTMIVVDNGKRYIGETVDVVVTTVLQTSAGRMIFTKLKDAE